MRQSKYTREVMEPVVQGSRSLAEVLRSLGVRPTGGNYRYFAARIRVLGLSTEHFLGQGWSKGRNQDSDAGVGLSTRHRKRTDAEVFVENSPETCGARLVRRLVRLGRPYACAGCGIAEWCGKPLALHLDHVNGVHNDNRHENLRFLCPNCHSQTDTYCNRVRPPAR